MELRRILEKVRSGELSVEEAEKYLRLHEYEKLSEYVLYDLGRVVRRGVPEIIWAETKTTAELLEVVTRLLEKSVPKVLVSRVREEHRRVLPTLQEYCTRYDYVLRYYEYARYLVIRKRDLVEERIGRVAVLCGGTADVPVAEEVRITAEEMGCEVLCLYDVGIANVVRVLDAVRKVTEFDPDVVVVVAGREAALPSLVASLLPLPIIAVPVSSGYGLGGGGLSALLSVLQSCVLGVLVVNIDNGVGAGVAAALIARRVGEYRRKLSALEHVRA